MTVGPGLRPPPPFLPPDQTPAKGGCAHPPLAQRHQLEEMPGHPDRDPAWQSPAPAEAVPAHSWSGGLALGLTQEAQGQGDCGLHKGQRRDQSPQRA